MSSNLFTQVLVDLNLMTHWGNKSDCYNKLNGSCRLYVVLEKHKSSFSQNYLKKNKKYWYHQEAYFFQEISPVEDGVLLSYYHFLCCVSKLVVCLIIVLTCLLSELSVFVQVMISPIYYSTSVFYFPLFSIFFKIK